MRLWGEGRGYCSAGTCELAGGVAGLTSAGWCGIFPHDAPGGPASFSSPSEFLGAAGSYSADPCFAAASRFSFLAALRATGTQAGYVPIQISSRIGHLQAWERDGVSMNSCHHWQRALGSDLTLRLDPSIAGSLQKYSEIPSLLLEIYMA
jgi:hypothetical protein